MMIEDLYTDFDTDITIRSAAGKSFLEQDISLNEIQKIPGVNAAARALEEEIILKHENKWVNAQMIGVDTNYITISKMREHMVDGAPILSSDKGDFALIGASLLNKLNGFIPSSVGHESLICYVPKVSGKSNAFRNKTPFRMVQLKLSGRFNYNKEVNEKYIVLPFQKAKKALKSNDRLSAIYVDCLPTEDKFTVKKNIQEYLGSDFIVKTNQEKNELIFKTSRSERLIVLFILIFIFILAAFNLVSSLIMLFVEKLDDVKTMISFGANKRFIFNIFFFEGLLIALKGIFIGLVLGLTVCFIQIKFELLVMPNSYGEPFPVVLKWFDIGLIFAIVSALSILFSYIPVRFLVNKNFTAIR